MIRKIIEVIQDIIDCLVTDPLLLVGAVAYALAVGSLFALMFISPFLIHCLFN